MKQVKNEVIAVDLGGTHLRVACVKKGKILNMLKCETPSTKKEILEYLINKINSLKSKNTKGVGISIAGFIKEGKVVVSPNLPLKNFDIKKFVKQKTRLKVEVENDANCVAIAEAKFGVKRKNFYVLTLGTGIGGGIIINGEIYKGNGFAGELGHIVLDKGRDFEYLASSKTIYRILGTDNEEEVKRVFSSKDIKYKRLRNQIVDYLGKGILSLNSVLDPEIVVLAGGITKAGESFRKEITKSVEKYSLNKVSIPKIKFSKIKEPGIIGASILIG